MRITWVATVFVLGCMSSEPTGSGQYPVLDGDWAYAPSISATPVPAGAVPEGVDATPVDLVVVSDDLVVMCDENGTPMGGYDPTDDGGEGGDDGASLHTTHNPSLGIDNGGDEAEGFGDPDGMATGETQNPNEGVVDPSNFENMRVFGSTAAWLHAFCL